MSFAFRVSNHRAISSVLLNSGTLSIRISIPKYTKPSHRTQIPTFTVHCYSTSVYPYDPQPAHPYTLIYHRQKPNKPTPVIISALLIIFAILCFFAADTTYRLKLKKIHSLLKMDFGEMPMGGLADAPGQSVPFYIKFLRGQQALNPNDSSIKTFVSLYGTSLLYVFIGVGCMLAPKLVMRHFYVVEMGYMEGRQKVRLVLPHAYKPWQYQERIFSVKDAKFLHGASGVSGVAPGAIAPTHHAVTYRPVSALVSSLDDVAIKVGKDVGYYRLALEAKGALMDKDAFARVAHGGPGMNRKFRVD